MILSVAIITGFKKEIQNKLIGFGAHIQITNYDWNASDEPQPISKNQDFITALRHDKNIKHIQLYATKSGIVKTKTDNEGVLLKGVGEDYDWQFIEENLKSGTAFKVNDTLARNVIISQNIANKLALKLNDKMVVYFLTKKMDDTSSQYVKRVKTFFVSGIYETGFEDIDNRLVLVDIKQIQALNFWDNDQIGGFEIMVNDYDNLDAIADELFYTVGQELTTKTIKETNATIFSWLELQDTNALIVIVLMVLVAGINMISALLVLILERTNMIGILKALGAKNKSVRKIFLYNAVYLISKGLFWGNIIGLSIAFIQYHFGLFKLDQTTYYVSVIPININLFHVVLLNAGTLVCCLLMLILPSLIITRITPVKAIRFS
jgi:lipoprotein-releasing system permease protein